MNYSDLVSAVEADNSERVNELIKAFYPRLMSFLRIHMNATTADAKDCAQDTIMISIKAIREGQVNDPDQIISYILTICKNTYLKSQKKRREKYLEEISPDHNQFQAPRQLQLLLDEEQKKLLKKCLNQLKESYRVYMQYWFDHPGAHTEKVAKYFGISVSNAWTRKHRLIRKLNECYRKKIKF